MKEQKSEGARGQRIKRGKVAFKVLFSLALLGFLAYQMDLRKFLQVLASARFSLVFAAALIQIGTVFIAVSRWRVILKNFGIQTRYLPLTKITFIGHFFNLFLPSAIGGDVLRAYYLSKRERRGMSTTLTTTVVERSAGLCALLGIGTFFAGSRRMEVQGISLFYFFLVLTSAYIIANVALFHSWIHTRLTRLFQSLSFKNVEAKLELVYQGLNTLRGNGRAIFTSLFLSLIIQFLSVVIMWVAAQGLSIQAPFYIFLIFIPIVNLTIMVPLTINGIGLRESVYYLLFSQIGLPVETSVTLSVLNFLVVLLASLPGAVIYSLYKREEHFDEILAQAESS